MQTIIQLTYYGKKHLSPYQVIATLPFLYDIPKIVALAHNVGHIAKLGVIELLSLGSLLHNCSTNN